MSRLDRYVATELIPPFVFGVGAFLIVLVGVSILPNVLKLVFRQGFPALPALKVFLLGLPGLVAMTLPMAMLFGSLMSITRLSGEGEVVAMRAGGISLARIGASVMVAGLLVSVGALVLNETIVLACNAGAFEITRSARETVLRRGDLAFELRDDGGRLRRWLYAGHVDPDTLTMSDALVVEFREGAYWHFFTAQRAQWQGETWVLENVKHEWQTAQGPQTETAASLELNIGRTVEELDRIKKDPEEMTLTEARQQAALAQSRGDRVQAGKLLQHIQIRLAVPWCSLGFAVLGLPLGLRRQRSSRGIGLGVSLVIIFAYYVVLHTLSILGERGVAHHVLIAWTPNVLLYLAALGLLLNSSR